MLRRLGCRQEDPGGCSQEHNCEGQTPPGWAERRDSGDYSGWEDSVGEEDS